MLNNKTLELILYTTCGFLLVSPLLNLFDINQTTSNFLRTIYLSNIVILLATVACLVIKRKYDGKNDRSEK